MIQVDILTLGDTWLWYVHMHLPCARERSFIAHNCLIQYSVKTTPLDGEYNSERPLTLVLA